MERDSKDCTVLRVADQDITLIRYVHALSCEVVEKRLLITSAVCDDFARIKNEFLHQVSVSRNANLNANIAPIVWYNIAEDRRAHPGRSLAN